MIPWCDYCSIDAISLKIALVKQKYVVSAKKHLFWMENHNWQIKSGFENSKTLKMVKFQVFVLEFDHFLNFQIQILFVIFGFPSKKNIIWQSQQTIFMLIASIEQ